jgi:hypothetical protein
LLRELALLITQLFDNATKSNEFWLGTGAGSNPEECINLFKFITTLTRSCDDQVELHAQADALLRRLDIPTRANYFVPSYAPLDLKRICDVRLGKIDTPSSAF